jgi:type VI secretion system protein ImpL
MSRLLKGLLLALGLTLVILLIFGIVLLLNWPLWVGIFLLLGFVGIGIGALFVHKIVVRRRERTFVQQIIEQDENQLRKAAGKEKKELKELQERWREAIETLRRSHLKKHGNPLYVLPWHLVMGESGSGKTTSISSARLSSPFVGVHKASGISGTRSCDWWFFEEAIVLDTAGRYAVPVDQGRDKEEWQRFLSLLAKYRKREPINGLIVTLAADKVVQSSGEALEEEGRTIRRRIDELMRVLGAKFPVYLLVTKCDLIQGMTQFCDRLPEKNLDQPMGVVNQELSTDAAAFVDRVISTVGERLRNLRLLLLHQPEAKEEESAFLIFPEEFENLKEGLQTFVQGAFQESVFQDQETPVLRGLFFSSGRQEGTPYSHFLSALGLIGQKEVLPGTNKGLFLHDFFAKVLPSDRGLLAPTRRAMQWQILTRNLGLTSWIILGLAIAGLMSFSFVKNLRVIRQVPDEFVRQVPLHGETMTDLMIMDRFAKAIRRVEDQNRDWWIPRFGLNESNQVEDRLKERYCKQYQEVLLPSLDNRMTDFLTDLTAATPGEVVGDYARHLVKRIHLLKVRLEGQDIEALQRKAQFSWAPLLSLEDQALEPDVREVFGSLYTYYLAWLPDEIDINTQVDVAQAWLRHLLARKEGDLQWLIAWTNQHGSVAPITLDEFWGASQTETNGQSIDPAFTRQGREQIDSFLEEMELALPDPMLLARQKAELEKWYRPACIEAWRAFGIACSNGTERLKSFQEWQQTAPRLTTEQGPYFALLTRMAFELAYMADTKGLPPWLQQVFLFQAVKAKTAVGGALNKAAQPGKAIISKLERALGKMQLQVEETLGQAFEAYQEYRSALETIRPVTTSGKQACQLVSQAFSEDEAGGKSPFLVALGAASTLNDSLAGGGGEDDVFWRLLTGPLFYLWSYATEETACYLQSQWENTVLAEVRGASRENAADLLLGPDGHVWKFIRKGPAAPFLARSLERGYFEKNLRIMDTSIPFDPSFLAFLEKGVGWQQQKGDYQEAAQTHSVSIQGLPTDANPEAKRKPHATRLELKCEGGASQTLSNFNYPVGKKFVWESESCSDVRLKIEVGDMVLEKRYSGPRGFPNFLRDFRRGSRVFRPREFPKDKAVLEALGIKRITVNYKFRGAGEVLRQPSRPIPSRAPRDIVRCWHP